MAGAESKPNEPTEDAKPNEGPKPNEPNEDPRPDGGEGDGGEGDVRDTHGQPGINKERHDREMAAKDAEIAELKKQVADAAKSEEAARELTAKIEALEKSQADERTTYRLELAGCRNAKAAKALLEDYDGDIDKLKASESWLFFDGKESKQTGTTGVKPGGAATGAPKTIRDALRQMGEDK